MSAPPTTRCWTIASSRSGGRVRKPVVCWTDHAPQERLPIVIPIAVLGLVLLRNRRPRLLNLHLLRIARLLVVVQRIEMFLRGRAILETHSA